MNRAQRILIYDMKEVRIQSWNELFKITIKNYIKEIELVNKNVSFEDYHEKLLDIYFKFTVSIIKFPKRYRGTWRKIANLHHRFWNNSGTWLEDWKNKYYRYI